MDFWERCAAFYGDSRRAEAMGYPTNPRTLEALGLYPFFRPIQERLGPEAIVDGRRCLMLGSNDYLGLTSDSRVQEAATEATRRHGSACTGSRLLNGTLDVHLALEDRLARFLGKEKALVFTTGYQACAGVLATLADRDMRVLADKEVHASLIDGLRLGRAMTGSSVRFFRHNDVEHLERLLGGASGNKLVVVDGVYSMRGDLAPLEPICRLSQRHGARLIVDDAHGLGVLGGGRGTAAHLGLLPQVDLILGTFSKSLASTGGFVAGPREVVHWIQHFARPFVFSASLPPSQVAAAERALQIIEEEPQRPLRTIRNAERLRSGLAALGWETGGDGAAIVSVHVKDQFRGIQAWHDLLQAGVYVNVALPPSVPVDGALLRMSVMATHSDTQIDRAIDVMEDVGTRLALLDRRGPEGGAVCDRDESHTHVCGPCP